MLLFIPHDHDQLSLWGQAQIQLEAFSTIPNNFNAAAVITMNVFFFPRCVAQSESGTIVSRLVRVNAGDANIIKHTQNFPSCSFPSLQRSCFL